MEPPAALPPPIIDAEVIVNALELISDADPTGVRPDPPELGIQEARAHAMAPLLDAELERVDRQHTRLEQLSRKLFDAVKLYHETMATQTAFHAG